MRRLSATADLSQPATNIFQRLPARIFRGNRAGTLLLIQVLAALRTQALAVFLADGLQRQRQKHLLAQDIFQQNTLALIVTDFGFRIGDRELIAPGIYTQGAIQQLELAVYIVADGLKTTRALQFQTCEKASAQAYIFNNLVLAVMFLDQFGAPDCFQRRALADICTKIDDTGLELFLKFARTNFQIFDVEEHPGNLRGNRAGPDPRKHARRA